MIYNLSLFIFICFNITLTVHVCASETTVCEFEVNEDHSRVPVMTQQDHAPYPNSKTSPFEQNIPSTTLNLNSQNKACKDKSALNKHISNDHQLYPKLSKSQGLKAANIDESSVSVLTLKQEPMFNKIKKEISVSSENASPSSPRLQAKVSSEDEEDDQLIKSLLMEFGNLSIHQLDFSLIPKIVLKTKVKASVTSLNDALNELHLYQNEDIHVFNRKFVAKHQNLYHAFRHNLNLKIDSVPQDFFDLVLKDQTQNLNLIASIKKLKDYNLENVDTETNIPISHLISAINDLCVRLTQLPHVKIDPYSCVVEAFVENIETRGGCKPGYAGRLFYNFLYLTNDYLNNVRVIYE